MGVDRRPLNPDPDCLTTSSVLSLPSVTAFCHSSLPLGKSTRESSEWFPNRVGGYSGFLFLFWKEATFKTPNFKVKTFLEDFLKV